MDIQESSIKKKRPEKRDEKEIKVTRRGIGDVGDKILTNSCWVFKIEGDNFELWI